MVNLDDPRNEIEWTGINQISCFDVMLNVHVYLHTYMYVYEYHQGQDQSYGRGRDFCCSIRTTVWRE